MGEPMALPEYKVQFDRQKFVDVVHYICHTANQDQLGRVKLHKILYFADMLNFIDFGRPLTGVEYLKQQLSPTARHLGAALRELEARGRLRVEETTFHGFPKYAFVSLSVPSLEKISDREQALLDDVIAFVSGGSASEISELSQNAAWEAVGFGDEIPYYTAYSLVAGEITEDDRSWACAEAQNHGEQV